MNNYMDQFLLSLMYAIKELETPLTSEEKKQLKSAGQQLKTDPTAWETYTKPMLKEVISKNSSLNKIFQNIHSNLEKISDTSQYFIQPTEDLVTVTPRESSLEERPLIKPDPEEEDNYELLNMSIQVLQFPEPQEKVKKISKLEKFWNLISQKNSDKK